MFLHVIFTLKKQFPVCESGAGSRVIRFTRFSGLEGFWGLLRTFYVCNDYVCVYYDRAISLSDINVRLVVRIDLVLRLVRTY
jgi:hypothetical protein